MKDWFNNHRKETGWLTAALVVMGVALTASNGGGQQASLLALADDSVSVPRSDIEAVIAELESWLETTPTTGPTTTGTQPTTTGSTTTTPTTTSTAPTTTSTQATTTSLPTTTTTGPLPTPTGERYDFFVNVSGVGRAWLAHYYRNLPYTPNTGWADGNRDGYKCAYGILMWNGEPAGRVTFTRIAEAAAYTIINDSGMPENGPTNRHYLTGLTTPQPVRQGECPPPVETYEPSTEPGQLPVIDFLGPDGQLFERRDYRTIAPTAPLLDGRLKFRLTTVNEELVTVIAYWENNPFTAIYYQAPWIEGVTVTGYLP